MKMSVGWSAAQFRIVGFGFEMPLTTAPAHARMVEALDARYPVKIAEAVAVEHLPIGIVGLAVEHLLAEMLEAGQDLEGDLTRHAGFGGLGQVEGQPRWRCRRAWRCDISRRGSDRESRRGEV